MKRHWIILLFPFLLIINPAKGQNLEGIKIYVNPGHGGFDSNDRNVPVPPFAQGDTAGFWESKSNLVKGLHLRSLLEAAGAEVIMSRTQNRTEDDRPLSAIAEEANANQVDFMISIHSNAFNSVTNYVLQLFHGWDNDPILPQSMDLAVLFGQNLISNQTSSWTHSSPVIRGDKSFAPPDWNGYGVLRPLTVPGLISEGSFHDYIPETYRLLNREYKHLEAWHFYRAFLDYYEGGEDLNGKIAGFVKDNYRKVTEYYTTANSKDQWLPVNGAKITLQPGDLEYTIDSLNNGFFLFDNLAPGTYRITVEADKYEQLDFDSVIVVANEVNYQLCYLEQDRTDPMQVLDYGPKPGPDGRVSAASAIEFHFNFEVDRESFETAFSVSPEVDGTFSYENQERTAKFIPDAPLDTSTVYHVSLLKSAKHIGGLEMEDDFSFSFLTAEKNRLTVLNMYPRNGMENVYENTQIRLHFDGRLKNTELSNLIRLEDDLGNPVTRTNVELNAFPGETGSYAFSPVELAAGQTYKLTVDANLEDVEGLLLSENMEIFFSVTEVASSSAPVVIDFEESALSWTADTLASENIIVGAGNRILRFSSNKLFGSYSYRLFYHFSEEQANLVVRPNQTLFTAKKGQFAGMYIWGNLSENRLVLLFEKDEVEYETLLCDIDFAGWQFRTAELNLPEEIEEYRFSGFKIISAGTAFSNSGVIFMDNLLISDSIFTTSSDFEKKNQKIKIYPNPVKNLFTIELLEIQGKIPFQIFDLTGKIVQTGYTEFISGKAQVELNFNKNGLYIISLYGENNKINGVFIKE